MSRKNKKDLPKYEVWETKLVSGNVLAKVLAVTSRVIFATPEVWGSAYVDLRLPIPTVKLQVAWDLTPKHALEVLKRLQTVVAKYNKVKKSSKRK